MNWIFPMNETQQLYAVEHHNLVYKYLRVKHLDKKTYYDIIIPGYLRAVVQYEKRNDLQQYRFSTIAWRMMNTELWNHRAYLNRKKRKADVISLDADTTAGSGYPLIEKLVSCVDPTQDLADKQFWLEVYSLLNESQIKLIKMLLNGYSRLDISRQLKIPFYDINEALLSIWNNIKGLFGDQVSDTGGVLTKKGA